MTPLRAFLIGLVLGAGAVALAPRFFERPDPGVVAAQAVARAARITADSAKAVAAALVDRLAAVHRENDALLRRPPRVLPGPSATTVIIIPDSGDTTRRMAVVPPEVVAQLRQDSTVIGSLVAERDLAQAAVASLTQAAGADSVAGQRAVEAWATERGKLRRDLAGARRTARWLKIGVAAGVVLIGAREISRALP